LSLASVQTTAGNGSDALNTVATLRKLPEPSSADPRIDLAEANAAAAISDFNRELSAAAQAASKARVAGARLLLAQARIAEGRAFRDLGELSFAKSKSFTDH